jgi:hypothetical protein
MFPDAYFDWVYVDGDHSYEGCSRDLELYAPKVRSGGFLLVDDYKTGWWGDGLIRAVDEFAARPAVEWVARQGDQVVLRV